MNSKKYKEGYVTLITVIIISAVSLTIASAMLMSTISASKVSLATEEGVKARAYANTCAEVALNKYRLDDDYDGNEEINFSDGECNIDNFDIDPGQIEINVQGLSGGSIRRVRVTLTEADEGVYESTWQEI